MTGLSKSGHPLLTPPEGGGGLILSKIAMRPQKILPLQNRNRGSFLGIDSTNIMASKVTVSKANPEMYSFLMKN